MKLTFWYAECLDDGDAYSIRTKTRKEALAKIKMFGQERFAKPEKIVLQYKDAMHLLDCVMGEGGFHVLRIN